MSKVVAIRGEAGAARQLRRIVRWLAGCFRCEGRHRKRQLKLCETLALGEKRFLAVVEFEQRKLLIGGTSSSLVMLAALPSREAAGAANASEDDARNSWTI